MQERRAKNSHYRQSAKTLAENPNSGSDYSLMMVYLNVQQDYVEAALAMSGEAYERKEFAKAALLGAEGRFYRPRPRVEAAFDGDVDLPFMNAVAHLMDTPLKWAAVPLDQRTVASNCLAYRLCASGASTCSEKVIRRSRKPPFTTFKSAYMALDAGDPHVFCDDLLKRKACLNDRWTEALISRYEARGLQMWAAVTDVAHAGFEKDVDNVPREAAHASNRRIHRVRSTQTNPVHLVDLSGLQVDRRALRRERLAKASVSWKELKRSRKRAVTGQRLGGI
jgi:hypothetical protein